MSVANTTNKLDLNDYFIVQFEDLLSDINCSEKISGTVSILFKTDSNTKKHIIPVCWRSGWGIGFENSSNFQSIKIVPLLKNMYLELLHYDNAIFIKKTTD